MSQNVRVQLTPLDVCAGWTQMSNYPAIARDGDVTELSIGDLRSEEDRIAVLELDVLQLPFIFDTLNGESLFKVKVLWDEITNLETKSCEYEQIVQISATQNEADIKINESTIRWVAVQQAAEALKTATNSVKMNNTRKAVETLMTTMKTLEDYGVPGKTQDGLDILQEFLDRLKAEQGFSSQSRKDAHETTAFLGRLSTTRRLASTTRFSPRFTKKLSKLLPSQ